MILLAIWLEAEHEVAGRIGGTKGSRKMESGKNDTAYLLSSGYDGGEDSRILN